MSLRSIAIALRRCPAGCLRQAMSFHSIPAGADGADGADGIDGEVTNAALATAINGTSNNTNAVATLDTPFADPDAEALRQRMNEFILAARRT